MKIIPGDFNVRYWWREGSVPPPYHYEYSINLSSRLEGSIIFYPDYPMEKPPVWTETFSVDMESLRKLYDLIVENELFGKTWTEIEDPPVGGSLEWLEVITGGNRIVVPGAINESQVVADIYGLIRDLVPLQIWDKLMNKYEAYQRDYLKNAGNDKEDN